MQRPLIDPEMQKLFVDRERGETSARPRFAARCSLKSTDRLDLRADWHEPSDDPSATESIAGAVDRHRGDKAFSVKITSPDDYAQRHAGFPRGGIPDHLLIAPDLIDVNLEVGHDLQAPKQHEFHDTRYRRIEYWLEGTTRFRECLPAGLLTEEVAGTPVPTEEHVKVVGPRAVTWIPSSAPPPAPEMLYVLPTFGWVRSRTEGGDASSWRRGGGLRVYLNGPWNASGYGEMLGVVLAPAPFTGDPESEPRAHPYKKLVTQWGNDPIWSSAFVHGLAPPRSSFPLARNAPDPAGAWLPDGTPATEAEQPPGPFRVTGLGSYDVPLEVAPHDVFYDAERRLWYCDIEIDQGASYWPFVRLALARYQPASVYGAELSEVVLADFMPLAADRWLTVTQGQDQRTRRVSVFGSSYRDSSGRLEASRAPSMSLIDPITGTTRALQPADVAGTSVIEVWIERLDPARGEDFGWERVLAGMAPLAEPEREAAAALPGAAGLARFVPAQEIARARELKAGRRFSDLLSEGLVENILGFLTLWDGTVTLPADPSADARLRLVIAEYEEYLVDDDNPYDRVPTRKGRRLVFVEHVELT